MKSIVINLVSIYDRNEKSLSRVQNLRCFITLKHNLIYASLRVNVIIWGLKYYTAVYLN